MKLSEARRSSASNEHFSPPEIIEAARAALGGIDLDPASCAEANEMVRATAYYDRERNGPPRDWRFWTNAANEKNPKGPLPPRTFLNPPGGVCDRNWQPVLRSPKGEPPCTETGICGLAPGHTHPDPGSSQKRWWFRLVDGYLAGEVHSAIFVCFSIELLQTSQVNRPKRRTVMPKSPLLVDVLSGTKPPVGSARGCLAEELPTPLSFPLCFPRRRIAYWAADASGTLRPGKSPTHGSMIVFLPPMRHGPDRYDQDAALARFHRQFSPFGAVVWPKALTVAP